jgi:iron complex transport system ATP-binding protein
LIEVRQARFAYPSGPPVIRGVTVSLEPGAMAALIGPNGCGKSTLVRLMAGLLKPSEGEILLDGRPLHLASPAERTRKIAYVPQGTARAFPFTAFEVVLTGRSPYLSRYAFEGRRDAEQAMEAMDAVGVAGLASRRITELSSGERQLVSLARALAQQPACILLDEPAASLDLKHRAALVRTLAGLQARRGLTVLLVTHDLSMLDPHFNVIFALRDGAMAATGSPREILQEAVLAEVFGDEHARVWHAEGRTFVWSEV